MAKHSGMKGSYLLIDFWRRCYYCTYFVHNPYLHDPDGRAFCDWCFGYLCVDDGIPEDADHWWCDKQCGSGSSTEHYEEGKPPRIPIIEVAFGKGMWSSSNGQVRFHARGMLPSRHSYRACHLRVQLCYSFMQALLQSKL